MKAKCFQNQIWFFFRNYYKYGINTVLGERPQPKHTDRPKFETILYATNMQGENHDPIRHGRLARRHRL